MCIERFPDLGDRRQISTDDGAAPLWSPDGRALFYRRSDTMMAVAVGGESTLSVGNPTALFKGPYFGSAIGTRLYDIDPAGKRFLMIKERADEATPQNLILVQHWTEELKRVVPTD